MKKKIILASTSPRRRELAKAMGLDFEVVPSSYEEDMTMKLKPQKLVMTLAYGKAVDVAKKYKEGIVIGIDTVVVYKNKVLGKPKTKEKSYSMLKMLSNKTHEVYSGLAVIDCATKKTIKDFEVTKVYFNKLTEKEIKSYIRTGQSLDKAGAYGVQDLSCIFVKRIDGCYFNIMGFPIFKLYSKLQKFGVDIFEYERWQ
jgi:septum formation protein